MKKSLNLFCYFLFCLFTPFIIMFTGLAMISYLADQPWKHYTDGAGFWILYVLFQVACLIMYAYQFFPETHTTESMAEIERAIQLEKKNQELQNLRKAHIAVSR